MLWRPALDAEDHIWLLFCVDVAYSIDRSPLPTLHLQPRHARRGPGFGPAFRGFLGFVRRGLLAPALGGCLLAPALGGLFALALGGLLALALGCLFALAPGGLEPERRELLFVGLRPRLGLALALRGLAVRGSAPL